MTHDNVTDIEARLRGNSCYNPQNGGMCDNTFTMHEAADTIATLRKELSDARSEALEEAAKAAELQITLRPIMGRAVKHIAAAIRALKGQKP